MAGRIPSTEQLPPQWPTMPQHHGPGVPPISGQWQTVPPSNWNNQNTGWQPAGPSQPYPNNWNPQQQGWNGTWYPQQGQHGYPPQYDQVGQNATLPRPYSSSTLLNNQNSFDAAATYYPG